jgi:hypothetical protein
MKKKKEIMIDYIKNLEVINYNYSVKNSLLYFLNYLSDNYVNKLLDSAIKEGYFLRHHLKNSIKIINNELIINEYDNLYESLLIKKTYIVINKILEHKNLLKENLFNDFAFLEKIKINKNTLKNEKLLKSLNQQARENLFMILQEKYPKDFANYKKETIEKKLEKKILKQNISKI